MEKLKYLSGFGNYHQSEAIPFALPEKQNSPQQCKFGLYAEQLSGTAFTRCRHQNLHSWLYRILPSVAHADYQLFEKQIIAPFASLQPPNPMRWLPFKQINTRADFISGLFHLGGSKLLNSFIYQCNLSMENCYFSNHDGEFLFVPYLGKILLNTEFGKLQVNPGEIAVIPRGVKFQVSLLWDVAGGYLCENKGSPLTLPELGLIGANALANPRHFLYPSAAYEDLSADNILICKYNDKLWSASIKYSPLNVVAWHGNYAPYKYDLSLFNTINTVSFDHPDPSIFTLLTSPSDTPGMANLDLAIFPPRWLVAEHTFRPPYFHRNIMNELMGLILGEYDAKKEDFLPGGISIHNCMTAHGPDQSSYENAVEQELKPIAYKDTLAFMLETKNPWMVCEQALKHESRQSDYSQCWQGLRNNFSAIDFS